MIYPLQSNWGTLQLMNPYIFTQIILKEREGKKGKTSADSESSGQEENREECLHFTDDLTQEPTSQDGKAVLSPSENTFIWSVMNLCFF